MQLKFLSNDAILDIKANFDNYKDKLISEDRTWLNNYLNEEQRVISTTIEVPDFKLQCEGDYNDTDIANSIEIYSKMKDIPIKVAASERMWAWMSLVYCWDYTLYRRKPDWKLETNSNAKQKDNKIFNSFLYLYGPSRSQVVNFMPRLWWASYYTYDDTRTDKFELTKFFCGKAFPSKVLLLQSSKITANKDVRLGLLSGLMDWCKQTSYNFKREHYVYASRYLNIIGGVSALDIYSRQDIYDITIQYLNKSFN